MLDFPNSPIAGQQFTAAGVTWTFDGAKWLPSGLSSLVVPGINDNRIINGDMRIDQRNNGAAGTAINVLPADRWVFGATQAGKVTWQKVLTGATGLEFPYCISLTSASAFTPAASDTFYLGQSIEADMVSDFMWGTASAKAVTLSFTAFSSKAGTFGGVLGNYAGTRVYPFTYTLAANAWTKIAITISGDTAGTWVMSGSGGSVFLDFDLGTGATYKGPPNAWASANYYGANGTTNLVSTNGAVWGVTGVKLEVGTVATPFNRQSLAKSLADCQRYYQTLGAVGQLAVSGYSAPGSVYNILTLPVTMRAAPTVVYTTPSYTNASALITNGATVSTVVNQCTITVTGLGYALAQTQLSAEL